MSDQLKGIFAASTPRPASSRPSIGPRVRGGPPLEGAPKLENDLAMSDAPNLDSLVSSKPETTTDRQRPTVSTPLPAAPAPEETAPADVIVPTEETAGTYATVPTEATVPAEVDVPASVTEPIVQRFDAAHLTTDASLGDPTSAEQEPAGEQVEQIEQVAARWAAPHSTESTVAFRLSCTRLKKSYRKANVEIPVLRDVSLGVREGEFLAIVGQSGCGKSTLLHLLGTLDSPDEGEIRFDGQRIDNLPGASRDTLRNEYFGMIFQFYHLLPELTTLENVLSPLMIGDSIWGYLRRRKQYSQAAAELLETVGLGHRLTHKPRELSGGEMQRAAIARALVTSPDVLLADEPTGNLDRDSGGEILDLLDSLNRQRNLTIVMVTHDPAIADRADRVVRLTDGRIEAA